jgi:hypothetical protein
VARPAVQLANSEQDWLFFFSLSAKRSSKLPNIRFCLTLLQAMSPKTPGYFRFHSCFFIACMIVPKSDKSFIHFFSPSAAMDFEFAGGAVIDMSQHAAS